MTGDRMRRVSELLEQALALDAAARGPFLDAACAGDAELRAEVASLIASHQQAGSRFLNEPPSMPDVSPSESGRRLGPYLVTARIGAGGMGEVFAAVRADGQYEQKVALKLVRAGYLNAEDIVERFRAERQILAGLDHPNIARLLDGGTTDGGAPYLVMELVDGVPIDDYCRTRDLSIASRLQLFLDVCAAVQYAHQRLVIHRDLKARNILVTEAGVPKLLDFGIAKMLDPAGGSQDTMLRPFTPEYASPEQVRGEPVSTASDVYSLGVVLYHMLTGRSPYRLDTHTPGELADAIAHREPERPSTAVTRGSRGSADTLPARVRRELRGDLDVIVLKALRKEPDKRYASVEQFAEDIRRYLNGHPVLARQGTWSYRAAKFARRHRTSVAAAALVLLTLIAGLIVTLREAQVARHQAAIASTERARAEKRFNDVRKLSDSLIFDVHDAIQSLPGATPARKLLLDRAVEYLDSVSRDAEGDPDLERELAWGYQRLAVVQGSPSESNLGDLDAALASDRKALTLFERVAAANTRETIDQLNVAMMHRILAYSTLTQAAGRRDLDTAMAITARLLAQGAVDPKVRSERSIEFQNLAFLQDASGDRLHALDSYRKNQELKLDILRTNPEYRGLRRGLGMATVLLGSALARAGQRDEALQALDRGIGFYEALQQEPDAINVTRELAISRQKRGDVLLMNGDLGGALAVYREVRRVLEPMAQADPQNAMLQLDVAGVDFHEARALTGRGAYDEAIPKLQRAVEVFERLHQTRSADDAPRGTGAIYIWLGEALAGRKDLRSALRSDERATAALTTALQQSPDDDTRCELAISDTKRANVLAAMGQPHDAAVAYQQALDIVAQNAGGDRQDIPALYVIADAYAGLGNVRAAEARQTRDPAQQSMLLDQARASYERSVATWKQIPSPARINPSGYAAGDPNDVSPRLASLRRHSGQDVRAANR